MASILSEMTLKAVMNFFVRSILILLNLSTASEDLFLADSSSVVVFPSCSPTFFNVSSALKLGAIVSISADLCNFFQKLFIDLVVMLFFSCFCLFLLLFFIFGFLFCFPLFPLFSLLILLLFFCNKKMLLN